MQSAFGKCTYARFTRIRKLIVAKNDVNSLAIFHSVKQMLTRNRATAVVWMTHDVTVRNIMFAYKISVFFLCGKRPYLTRHQSEIQLQWRNYSVCCRFLPFFSHTDDKFNFLFQLTPPKGSPYITLLWTFTTPRLKQYDNQATISDDNSIESDNAFVCFHFESVQFAFQLFKVRRVQIKCV